MKNFGFLIAAYSAIWLLVGYYFFRIGSKVNELTRKVEQLEAEKHSN